MNRNFLLTCILFTPIGCGVDQLGFEIEGSGGTSLGGALASGGSGSGGTETGGTGGTETGGKGGEDPLPTGGFGGMGGFGGNPGPVQLGDLFAEATTEVTAIETNETHVYWMEYGTFDDLGNYLRDGKLLRAPIRGGDPEIMAENLQGPRRFFLSGFAAFITVDESVRVDPAGVSELWSVPIEGGVAKFVQRGNAYGVGSADHAIWRIGGSIFGQDDSSALTGSAGLFMTGRPVEGDFAITETHVYWNADHDVYYAPLSDLSAWSLFSKENLSAIGHKDSTLYGLSFRSPAYLMTTPLDQDPVWTRALKVGSGHSRNFELFGPRFFVGEGSAVITGDVLELDAHEILVPWDAPWAGSLDALFYAEDADIYRVEIE